MTTELFEGISPLFTSIVQPNQSIQAAVNNAKPGTRIEINGTHTENVVLNALVPTTITTPIWLVGMNGAKIIAKDKTAGKAIIAGWRCSNYAVLGLVIESGYRGVYFASDDAAETDLSERHRNILIRGCTIKGMTEDGIKLAHLMDYQILANDISDCGPAGENADVGVNCWNGWVAYNRGHGHTGTANIMSAKKGSRDIIFEHNECFGGTATGICAGGYGSSDEPAHEYQAKNIIVRKNKLYDVARNPFSALGGHDVLVEDNYLATRGTYSPNVACNTGKYTQKRPGFPDKVTHIPSKRVVLRRNKLVGSQQIYFDPTCVDCVDEGNNNSAQPWDFPVGPEAYKAAPPVPVPVPPPADCSECEAALSASEEENVALTADNEKLKATLAQIHEMTKP